MWVHGYAHTHTHDNQLLLHNGIRGIPGSLARSPPLAPHVETVVRPQSLPALLTAHLPVRTAPPSYLWQVCLPGFMQLHHPLDLCWHLSWQALSWMSELKEEPRSSQTWLPNREVKERILLGILVSLSGQQNVVEAPQGILKCSLHGEHSSSAAPLSGAQRGKASCPKTHSRN